MSAFESRETATAGSSDIGKQPVTVIPSYDLQGADRFIMPALTNDTAYKYERDFGIHEQLASICQLLLDVQSKQGQMASELQEIKQNQQIMKERMDESLRMGSLVSFSGSKQEHDSSLIAEIEAAETKDRKRFKERLKKAALRSSKLKKPYSWLEYLFGICPADQRMGKPGNSLVHPHCLFMQVELLFSGLLLLYTAVVAPVQICMWNYEDPCNKFPTLYFDVFVDAFFLAETLLMFFVGYYNSDQTYVDFLPKVVKRHLSSPLLFWFDAVTSIPFSCLDLVTYQTLCKVASLDVLATTALNGEGRVIRVFKIFRILKVLRLLKLVKLFGLVRDYAVIYMGSDFFKVRV